MTEIHLNNVSLVVNNATLLKAVTANFHTNELVVLIGPNGAGKTSLLKCVLGLSPPTHGNVTLDDSNISNMSPIERARLISYLPQMRPLAWPVLVKDVVALGRYAYGATPGKLSKADNAAIEQAMINCSLMHLNARNTDTLSGGELARVHCARAFAANTPLLFADEPTAALDPNHQFKIMGLVRKFVDEGGGAVVVLHDISLAAKFADRVIWMDKGEIVADGSVAETLTTTRMQDVFGVTTEISMSGPTPTITVTGVIA